MSEEKKPEELTEEEQRAISRREFARKVLENLRKHPTRRFAITGIHVDIFPDRRKKPDESEQE